MSTYHVRSRVSQEPASCVAVLVTEEEGLLAVAWACTHIMSGAVQVRSLLAVSLVW